MDARILRVFGYCEAEDTYYYMFDSKNQDDQETDLGALNGHKPFSIKKRMSDLGLAMLGVT